MFQTPLILKDVNENDLWALSEPLVWADGDGKTIITVPKGFITDLASIPMLIRNIPFLDPNGVSRRPAALHDWLYAGARQYGKAFADDTLRAALYSEGASKRVASIFYYGVHLFGKSPWAGDGNRHPYALVPSDLQKFDFLTEDDYNAWKQTTTH